MKELKLSDWENHPFFKEPDKEYYYIKNGTPKKAMLKTLKINIRKFTHPFDDSLNKFQLYFKYSMYNGDNPLKLYEDKDLMVFELQQSLINT